MPDRNDLVTRTAEALAWLEVEQSAARAAHRHLKETERRCAEAAAAYAACLAERLGFVVGDIVRVAGAQGPRRLAGFKSYGSGSIYARVEAPRPDGSWVSGEQVPFFDLRLDGTTAPAASSPAT